MKEIKPKQGSLYHCLIESKGVRRKSTIIPLAKNRITKRQFVLLNAKNIYKEYPEAVKELTNKSFFEIMTSGAENMDFFDFSECILLFLCQEDGSLLDYDGQRISNFVYVDVV